MTRLRNKLAKPLLEMFRLINQSKHHFTQLVHFLRQNVSRMIARRQVRIAVIRAAQLTLQNVIGEAADQFAGIWRAETDRIVHGVFQRIAFVRESWWNVQDIAGFQLFIDDGFKRGDLQQVRMRAVLLQLQFFAHAPATSPGSLNDKHIVLIKMWANAAAGDREGDHQIVNPPVRQFAKRTHQRGGGFMPVIDRLYQQRPVVLAEMIIAFERTVANLPFTVLMADESAVDFAFHCQSSQFVRREWINKVVKPTF